jgi:hypothetical protein
LIPNEAVADRKLWATGTTPEMHAEAAMLALMGQHGNRIS